MKRLFTCIVVPLAAIAIQACSDTGPDQGIPDGGALGSCNVSADCTGLPADSACAQRSCENGQCRLTFVQQGTGLSEQVAGDCQRLQCNGQGSEESVADNQDVPADDGNECTTQGCNAGEPAITNVEAGTMCGEGGSLCNGQGICGECTGEAGEPGDNTSPSGLPSITDDDDDGSIVSGVLSGSDIDLYTYLGNDSLGDVVDPSITVTVPQGVQVSACQYADCPEDPTEVTCPMGSMDSLFMDMPGCCALGTTTVTIDMDLNCDGAIDDDADIVFSVEQTGGTCVDYTVDYHY